MRDAFRKDPHAKGDTMSDWTAGYVADIGYTLVSSLKRNTWWMAEASGN